MRSRQKVFLFASIPVLIFAFTGKPADAVPYAVAATNVTMPAMGLGTTQYTVTGIPMTGTLSVTCNSAGTETNLKIPTCTYGPLAEIPVTAGQTVTGTISFYPYGSAIPANLHRARPSFPAGVALAGALLLGLRLRRLSRTWLAASLLSISVLAGLAGIAACGGSSFSNMTPGTYQYAISAGNESGGATPLREGATTTISVTVP